MRFSAKSLKRGLEHSRDALEQISYKQIEPYLKALAALLALFAVFHVPELTNFTLSIDDEYAAYRGSSTEWLSQGRWLTYLFERLVLPLPVMPFLPIALFGLFCAIAYLLFLRALGENRLTPLSLAFFPIFSSFPTWVFLTAFQSNTPSSGLGLLLSCLGAVLYRKTCEQSDHRTFKTAILWRILLIGFLGACAIGCYQSFILFLAIVFLASIISMNLANRAPRLVLKDAIIGASVLVCALIFYAIIFKLSLAIMHTEVHYIDGFIRPEFLRQPFMVIKKLIRHAGAIYLGSSYAYGIHAPPFGFLLVIAAAGILYRSKNRLFAALLIFILMTLPFVLDIMSGGAMPLRSLIGVPVAITALGFLGFKAAPRWLSRIGLGVLMLCYFSIFVILCEINAARELVQIHDHEMAGALTERIERMAGVVEPGKPLKLDVYGAENFQTPYPRIGSSTIGYSFFEWDQGNPSRIVTYMKLLGLPSFDIVAPQERTIKLVDTFALMPVWPARDSVRILPDGTVLVKLSDNPGPPYRKLLSTSDPTAKPYDMPFYRLSGASAGSWSTQNVSAVKQVSDGIELETKNDPNFIFQTNAPQILKNCHRIELHARLKIERPDLTQIFYKVPGQDDFQGEASTDAQIQPAPDGGFIDVNLQFVSRTGFTDSFRFDPVDGAQNITLGEIELYCRMSNPVIPGL